MTDQEIERVKFLKVMTERNSTNIEKEGGSDDNKEEHEKENYDSESYYDCFS